MTSSIRNNVLLYEKVKTDLRQRILKGNVKPDENLGSERQLLQRYGVSRITVRKALQDLETEGLIYRLSGKGTFVRTSPPKNTYSHLVTLSVFDLYTDAFYAEIFSGIHKEAQRLGFHLINVKLEGDSCSREMINRLSAENPVGGYLLIGGISDDLLAFMKERKKPIVLVDNFLEDESLPAVFGDNAKGAYDAVNYLIGLGHRKIVHLARPVLGHSFSLRQIGWEKALSEARLPSPPEFSWKWDYNNEPEGKEVRKKLFSEKPTAIFCANDSMAIHLLKLLEKIPMEVPKEISVAGFDDALLAKLFSLTTVSVPKKEMGAVAIKRLINQIQGTDFGPTNTILPLHLVVRNSTAKPNHVQ